MAALENKAIDAGMPQRVATKIMFSFTTDERFRFTEMRAIATDDQGREVLVGLKLEETAFYMDHTRRFTTNERDRDPDNRKRYLELHKKYERSRLAVIGVEIQSRNENPPLH